MACFGSSVFCKNPSQVDGTANGIPGSAAPARGRASRFPTQRPSRTLRSTYCFGALPPAVGGVAAGAFGACSADGEVAAGALTTGVTVTPVTLPLTASFCFLLVVPRAARVALAFAAAAAFCSLVLGVRALGG